MSVTSSRGSSYAESVGERHSFAEEDLWHPKKNLVAIIDSELSMEQMQLERRDSISTENSNSTLALDLHNEELDLKTPTIRQKVLESTTPNFSDDTSDLPAINEMAGPMEHLLQSLLRQVVVAERSRPTIMADNYARLQRRLDALEAEKRGWIDRHEALLILRDDDLTSLVQVRGLLANERREHAAIRKLRDDDLDNVFVLREKLAQATWSKLQRPTPAVASVRQSRTEGDDLWQVAKTAAMEQRILELEKANKELRAQMTESGTGGIISRVENMFEDSLKHREKMATKVHQLRSEKEGLQKEVATLEDRNTELEAVIERLQRNTGF